MGRNNINKKRGKSCKKAYVRGASAPRLNPVTAFIRASLPAGLLLGLPAGSALAGPEGGVVAAGEGSIATPDASTTVINQASQNLIVNWESFNVNTHETVNFKQPNRSAQALNRIFDQNPSQIFGSLNANGKVLLINPNGVFFSPTARVNVGGLVASGLNIKDEDFMAGRHTFFNQDGSEGGMVVNQGLISAATGGSVTLIGGAVKNEGTILATAGQVNLVAGKKVTMDFDGDGLIQFTVNEEILQNAHDLDDAISNTGTINADGGSVLLHGKAAKDVFTNVVNNSGVIGANKIQNEGGQIKLVAGGAGNSLLNTGIVDASSSDSDGGNVEIHAEDKVIVAENSLITTASATGKGGKVQITGDKVGLTGETSIDASGDTGGGEVLVGGDLQGNNPDVINASKTYVGSKVSITADAVTEGDGGNVIVWADDATYYDGSISATGGELLGNGGFVEISGKKTLAGDFVGSVDTSATNGKTGTLLLDPTDIEILDGAGDSDPGATNDGNATYTGVNGITVGTEGTIASTDDNVDFNDLGGAAVEPLQLYESELEGIAATTNIILQATNNITIADLTDDNLNLAQTVGNSVTFTADADGDNTGNFVMTGAASDTITTAGGAITISGDGITIGGISSNGGAITLNADSTANGAGGVLTIQGVVDSNGGDINLLAENFTISAGIDSDSGNIYFSEPQVSGPLTFGDELDQAEVDLIDSTGIVTFGQATDAIGGTVLMNSTTVADGTSVDFTAGARDLTVVFAADTTLNLGADGGDASADTITASSLTLDTTTGATVTQGTGTPDVLLVGDLIFSGAGTITLNNATNDVDTLAASGTTAVTFRDLDEVDFAAANFTASSLNLTTGGAITDTGTITISGVTTLNANAGASEITLNSTGNDFDSDDSGDEVNAAGTNITLVDTDAIELGDIDDGGDFTITAGGAVTQTAAGAAGDNVDVTGTTSITATGFAVTLDEATNDFGGAVSVTGTNISLRDTNAIELDDIDDGGAFTLTAGGAVTQTAAGVAGDNVDVTGTTSITASGFAVTLDEATNDFVGAVSATGTNLSLTDANSLVLGTVNDAGDFVINFDASDGGAESLSFNNDVNVNSIAVSGTSSNDTVNLGADADIIAATGDIVIGAAQNIIGIDINGAGSNIITATAGAIDLAAVTDSAAVNELELNAGTDITLAGVTLNSGGTALLDIDLDEGADGTQNLDLNGDIIVGSLTIDGQNANDTVLIGSNVDITTSTGDIAMGATQNISAVTLDGAGSNTLTATAGAIDLAALTDTANITILNLRADTGVTLDSVTLNNAPGSSILDIRFDQGGDDAAALNVSNALTAGSLGLVLGQGTNDTMTFGGLITTSSGSVSLANAATININGGINAASNIDIDAVTTVNAAAGGNSITGTAIEIRDNNNVGTFNITGPGLLTLDASSPGTIALADITDSADADLTIDAGSGITAISSVNMDGGGTLTVDVGTNAATGAIANFVGTVTAGVIDFSGFEGNDTFNIQNTLTATAGSVNIDTANNVDVADISATGAITVDVSSGVSSPNIDLNGTSYTSNDGNISFVGNVDLDAAGLITIDSDANNDATDGTISFTGGAINDNAAGDSALIVDADTADVSLSAIGTTTRIGTLTVTGNDIAFNGNVESTSITATAVEGADADSINIAAGVTLDANSGNMSFRSDDIIIDGTANLVSTGGATSVTFAAEAAATAIGLGDSAAGILNLSETELNRVGSTFGEIVVGVDTSQSGAIEVNDSGGLTIANTGLRLRAEAGGADITIGSNLNLSNATSAFSIEGSFATTNLNANITTTGGTVNIADDVLVNGARTIDTTAGNTVNAAGITITGFIDGANSAGTDTLTLDAARNAVDGVGDALVDLQNAVEGAAGAINVVGGQDLEGLTITGSQIDVANVRVEGSISISGTNIDLNGTTYRSDDNGGTETISFTGPVDLHNNVVVTGAGGASENISFTGTINADDATANNRTLVVNAGAGAATFGGTIGVAQPLADFDVTAATINLNGGTVRVDDQGGNTVLLTGAVTLGSNVTIDTDGAVDNNLNIAGTINADDATANNRTLAVTAGTGTATFAGIIGGTQQLADFDVTANTINLNTTSIRVDDNNAPAATSTMTGAVRLGANLVYDTDKASGTDSSVTFTNTVNADAVGNNRTLTVTAGGGTARFQNAVGGTQALADFDATANLIRLQGNVTANAGAGGQTVTLTGPVQIENNVTINTDGTNDNNVSLTSTVNALDATTNNRSFSVTSGTGNITVSGAMGNTQPLDGGVTLSGATINTAAITTNGTASGANQLAGNVTITGTAAVTIAGAINAIGKGTANGGLVDIDAGAANALSVQAITANSAGGGTGGIIKLNDDGGTGIVTLNGDLTSTGATNGGNITLGSATRLGAATVNISTGATGGNITFDNTLNSTPASNRALVLTAGTGNVTVSGIAGGTAGAELLSFTVNSANNVSLQALTTDTGAITIGTNATTRIGGILTLNGNLTSHDGANAAGAINLFADDIRLVGAGPGTITLNSNGSADAAITIATDTGGGGTLASNVAWLDGITLDAGGATVNLGNAAINSLDHLDVTANTLSLGDTTLGDGAGNGGVGLDINTAGNLTLNGDISTAGDTSNNAGGIDLAGVGGNILLNNGGAVDATTVTITANATGTDAAITLGTVQDNGSDINLAVDAGTADATLNAVGTTDAIGTLTVAGNDIAFNGNVESTTITATAVQNGGDNDSIVLAGGVTLDANGGNMTFRTDDIAFPGSASLTSTGGGTSVTFTGETDATTIGLGTGSAGTLQLTQDELNIVDSTFTEIIVGVDGTQSGTIQVDDSGADNNLTINNTGLRLRVETAPGDIDINSTITIANTGSDFNIEGAGDTTLLSGDITTNGGDIIIDDTVLVDGTRTLDSGNSATAAAAGLIQITGDIGSVDTTGDTLTLDARSVAIGGYGAVNVVGDVGAGTVNGAAANDLTGFTVFGNQVDVASIEVTSGNIALSAVTNIDLNGATYQTTTSGSITIGAELGAGSGTIDLDQAGGLTTIQTAGGAGDDILIESPIRDGDATQLTLNAGANGDVTADTIGALTAIGTVDVDGDQISLDSINVDNGDIFVTGNNIDLNSGFTITTAGEINVTGPVLLTGASSSFTTAGGAGDDITFSSTIDDDAAGDNILVLDADAGGAGNVTVGGAIGGITRVRQVDIDGVVINVDSIRVDGVATGAANMFVGTLGTTTTLNLNGANYDSINSPTSGIIRFDGPVTLNQAGGTTTVSSTSGANSDITFRGTVDDDAGGDTALVVDAGAAGDISFQQAIGDTTPIASLTITNANQLGINNVTTTGFQSMTASAINLSGTTYESTTSGTISFFGPVNLFNNTVTVTSAGAAGNDISFSSTIDADDDESLAGDRSISLVAGAGDVTVTGAIGGTEALDGGVTISGANISTNAITTDGADGALTNKAGGAVDIDATGGTIIIGGAISTIGLGLSPGGAVEIDADGTNTISVQGITTNNTAVGGVGGIIQLNDNGGTGLVTLNGDLTSGINAAGGAITVGSATELATGITISTGTLTGDITFDTTLNSEASENNTLGLTAGTGSITFTGAVGSGFNQELGAVTVNSANNVTATSTLEAASFTQIAGTGTTQINDQMDLTAAGTNTSITTDTIDLNANINTNGGNVVLSAASGVTLDGGNIDTTGILNAADTTDNAGTVDIDVTGAGNVAMTGNIDTTGADSNASAAGDGGLVTIDTFDGDITVNNITTSGGVGTGQNGGNAAQIQLTAGDDGTSSGDDITIGTLTSLGGAGAANGSDNNVTLAATGGAIVDGNANAAGDNVQAAILIADARDGVGSGNALETTVTSIDIDNSNANNIEIAESDGLIVTRADQATDADANDIIISTTTGDIEVDSITTGGVDGDVTLTASAGAVTDRLADTNLDISADVLTIDADTGVGSANALETVAATFDIDNNTSGNIDIDNNYTTGLVTLTNLNVAAGAGTISFDNTGNQSLTITSATTNTGDISITNTGDANTDTLTVGTTVSTAGSGTISLSTLNRGDIAINGGIDASTSGGTITVSAADNMSFGAVTLTTGAGTGQINLNVDSTNTQAATLNLTNASLTSADINLDSGTAGDTLIGQNVANTWTITGADTGTLGNANLSVDADYTDFDNLTGNANSDLFDFNGGTVSGNVDGAAGTNTLDYAGLAGPISVTLSAAGGSTGVAGTASNISGTFDDIDSVVGSGAGDSLTGFNTTATWTLDGGGTENYLDTGSGQDLDFTNNFNTITGGAGDDTFNITTVYTADLIGDPAGAGNDGSDSFVFDDGVNPAGTAQLIGSIDGGVFDGAGGGTAVGNDSIDFSGSKLGQKVTVNIPGTDNGQQGQIEDEPLINIPPNTDLITAGFDNINSLTGNGLGVLLGPNQNTWWNVTGTDTGFFGDALTNITTGFNNFSILGGNQNDVFIFQNAGEITLGIDGGVGNNILAGTQGADTFNINDTFPGGQIPTPIAGASVNFTTAAGTTYLTNIDSIDGTDAFTATPGTDTDTGADIFNITVDWSGNLNGVGGNDSFVFTNGVTVGGSITGGTGSDTLNWAANNTSRSVLLTTSTVAGFSGTEASITGGFVTIDVLTGGTVSDTLTGRNTASTWTLDGTPQYTDGTATLDFSAFEVLQGGTNTDAFNVTAASAFTLLGGTGVDTFDIDATLTGSLDGEGGADILQGTTIDDVLLTGSNADGFAGTEADITANFDGISVINGTAGTLTGQDVASTWALGATQTYNNGSHTLTYTGFANLQGGTNTDAFNVTVANAYNLRGGAGVDAFDIDATLTGLLDGEAGADTLQGDAINAVVLTGSDGDGFAGTETDITGNFDGISVITGNGGTLTGQNVASTWDLDGTPTYNNGTHILNYTGFANLQGGTNTDAFNVTTASTFNLLGGGNVDTFDIDAALTGSIDGETGADILQGNLINNVVLTGSDADGFAGTEADISTGFDGITVITGNGGTLTGRNVASIWDLDGTPTYSDGNVLNYTGFANLQGGTAADDFNVTIASAFNLRGGAGADDFDIDATLTGSIDGEAGADILQGALISNVVLTGSDADGYAGTEADISGNFDGIQVLTGTNAALTGQNVNGAFNVTGGNSGTYAGGTGTLTFTGVQNLTGGSANDSYTFTNAGSIAGSITDNGGTDTLVGDDDGNAFVVTGANTGTLATKITGTWSGVENLTGGAGADTFNVTGGTISGLLNGAGGAGDSATFAGQTVTLNGTNTGISNIETVNMGGGTLVGSAGTTAWNLNAASAGTANDGTTTVAFTNTPTIRGGAGADTFTSNGTYNGTVNLTDLDNTWNYTPGAPLTNGAVTGTGSLTIPGTNGAPLDITTGDLELPNLGGFTGHTIIGGSLTPAGATPFYEATAVTFNTTTLTVTDAITSGGSVTLLGGDILLNNDITLTSGTIGLVAAGPSPAGLAGTTGNIDASAGPVTLTAPAGTEPSGAFIAQNDFVDPDNITLAFGGGEVDVATGVGDQIEFNGASISNDIFTDPEFEAFVNGILGAFNLTLVQSFSINPASALIGLETLAFIDLGLFEEELQLFGTIGTGIALALAQCEEQEGCAPNVTEDELNTLIATLEARIEELRRRLEESDNTASRVELEELIEGFNKELQTFNAYLAELQAFFSAEAALEEELEDDFIDEEPLLDGQGQDEISVLAGVLETIKARIEWLEGLKEDPQERNRLSEATGIELTLEELDKLIEAARAEAAFIENRIRLLIEGTEAGLGVQPIFTAEARDYDDMQVLHFGPDLLQLDNNKLARTGINVY